MPTHVGATLSRNDFDIFSKLWLCVAVAAQAWLLAATPAVAQDPSQAEQQPPITQGPPSNSPYQVGDVVVASKETALKVSEKTVAQVGAGFTLVVRRVEGSWLWVESTTPGWIATRDVMPLDQAVQRLSAAIESSPRDARALLARGHVWRHQGEHARAIRDYSEAIRLNPKSAFAYTNRAYARFAQKEYRQAIEDLDQAIRLEPKDALAFNNRGYNRQMLGLHDEAIADYEQAIRLDAKLAAAYNNRAWLWATAHSAEIRDGRKAVQSAIQACRLTEWKNLEYLDTLAAAYAERGDFEKAANVAAYVLKKSPDQEKDTVKARLELYRSERVYRHAAND